MTVEVEVVQIRAVLVLVIVLVEYIVTCCGVVVVNLKYVSQGIVVVLGGRTVESVSVIVEVTADSGIRFLTFLISLELMGTYW